MIKDHIPNYSKKAAVKEVKPMVLFIFIISIFVFGLAGAAYSAYKISLDMERTEFEDRGSEYD